MVIVNCVSNAEGVLIRQVGNEFLVQPNDGGNAQYWPVDWCICRPA